MDICRKFRTMTSPSLAYSFGQETGTNNKKVDVTQTAGCKTVKSFMEPCSTANAHLGGKRLDDDNDDEEENDDDNDDDCNFCQ